MGGGWGELKISVLSLVLWEYPNANMSFTAQLSNNILKLIEPWPDGKAEILERVELIIRVQNKI